MVGMVRAAAEWGIDRRSMSRRRSSTTSALIWAGVEGMFAGAIGGDASAVPLAVHSAFP
jgi:hypothetical protein